MVSEAFAQPLFKGVGRREAGRMRPGVGKASGICCLPSDVSVIEGDCRRVGSSPSSGLEACL